MNNNTMRLNPIGRIRVSDDGALIEISPDLRRGLRGLDEFSHVQILWAFDQQLEGTEPPPTVAQPYPGVDALGVFATRSPDRPNPLALSTAAIASIDEDRGLVWVHHVDARDGSLVLDLKPYTPSLDRVEHPRVPQWCAQWPLSLEASASFDWSQIFADA